MIAKSVYRFGISLVAMLAIRWYRYGLYIVILLCANSVAEQVGASADRTAGLGGVLAMGAIVMDILLETLLRLVVLPLWRIGARAFRRWLSEEQQ